MALRTLLISLIITIALSSCTFHDYSRRCIQQGNILSKTRADRLKIGMNKSDVAILMGTSAISPLFNNDRWYYAYTYRKDGKIITARHLVLTFKHDKLANIEHTTQPLAR